MAVSLNSVIYFNSRKLEINLEKLSRSSMEASIPRISQLTYFGTPWPRSFITQKRCGLCLSIKSSNQLDSDTDEKTSPNVETSIQSDNQLGVSSSDEKKESTFPKKSTLTAKERLRAARVLSRYTELKSSKKPEMGAKVLDAMRESDGGKRRSGLPEAPTNMLDDSKRGLPKAGLTFDFPGGFDLFLIIFSFVFISTIMFGTTYIVWKAGAIHFNEY